MKAWFLLLLLPACATTTAPPPTVSFPLTGDLAPFPADPLAEKPYTYRETTTVRSESNVSSSVAEVVMRVRVEALGKGQWRATHQIEKLEQKGLNGTIGYSVSASPALDGVSVAITYDCPSRRALEQRGLSQALARVAEGARSPEEARVLSGALHGFSSSTAALCEQIQTPFRRADVVGKAPGHQWRQPMGMEDFPGAEAQMEFLGWHESEGARYALLRASHELRAVQKPAILESAGTYQLLVSADWRRMRKILRSENSVSAPGEAGVRGRIEVDSLVERLP